MNSVKLNNNRNVVLDFVWQDWNVYSKPFVHRSSIVSQFEIVNYSIFFGKMFSCHFTALVPDYFHITLDKIELVIFRSFSIVGTQIEQMDNTFSASISNIILPIKIIWTLHTVLHMYYILLNKPFSGVHKAAMGCASSLRISFLISSLFSFANSFQRSSPISLRNEYFIIALRIDPIR